MKKYKALFSDTTFCVEAENELAATAKAANRLIKLLKNGVYGPIVWEENADPIDTILRSINSTENDGGKHEHR